MGFTNSVQSVMTRGFRKIDVSKIRINPDNFYAHTSYEEEAVKQMADLILEDGQDANIVVYQDDDPDDGLEYTLISGERRLKAVKKLVDMGEHDGMIQAKVEEKPADKDEELLRLIRGNSQRSKGKDIRRSEILALQDIWNRQKAEGKTEGKFVDWAAASIGLSPRQVTNYLSEEKKNQEGTVAQQEEPDPRAKEEEIYIKKLRELLKDHTGGKVSLSNKKVIMIKCQSLEEMEADLAELGFGHLVKQVKGEQ
ncbi:MULTISPECIES: ParB/RepB/Spo0J family partition protein [Erysipelotrichaceae]|uniref:ParB/RepB/Spo0J family partition protein n=1 Tax=Erysipelotrichaceae TaxID=128827 RepID=UPI00259AF7B6|nr:MULTISPECIES: ParB N-terminal domain-containing protein [Erysipelotrichaceae]